MFKGRFKSITCKYIPDQNGNYRATLQENKDAQERLGWKPKDRLEQYISTL
jgi:UDP-glucose 4-epimerase